jgi:hypothetical protein
LYEEGDLALEKQYIDIIRDNAETVRKQWNDFAWKCKDIDSFKRRFHLRPTKRGVTIISTLENMPMRGFHCAKTKVLYNLKKLDGLMEEGNNLEVELGKLGFSDRGKFKDKIREEDFQAKMIAGMSENVALKNELKVEDLIFIASEFILHEGKDTSSGDKIDIVAFDGKNRLFFFELKDPNNKRDNPEEQVKRYIKLYGGDKRKDMLTVLKKYPINSVATDDIVIEGYAVYGYGEEITNFKEYEIGKAGRIDFCNGYK